MLQPTKIPDVFCWTKMGTEAGQPLRNIIARKEAERELGDGIFFWGIGTSLGTKLWDFIDTYTNPVVLFSPMRTKPKVIDKKPDKLFVWSSYFDRFGVKHKIPDHILVTSRGTANGSTKNKHYALVCRKRSPLINDTWPSVDILKMKNYRGATCLGYSQVTTIVEYSKTNNDNVNCYEVSFGAELVYPYFVRLTDPIELPIDYLSHINSLGTERYLNTNNWCEWLRSTIHPLLNVLR